MFKTTGKVGLCLHLSHLANSSWLLGLRTMDTTSNDFPALAPDNETMHVVQIVWVWVQTMKML